MNSWFTLSSTAKGLDLLFISLFLSFVLFSIGTFIKWIKPSKGKFSTKEGLILEFDKKNNKRENEDGEEKNVKGQNPSLFACIDESTSFRNELTLVISKSIRFGYEMAMLKEVITIRNQMNSAQVKADLIKNIFVKEFSVKIIDRRNQGEVISPFTYDTFNEFMTQIIKTNILNDMKNAFKQNGIAEITLEEYEDSYCKDRIKRILTNLRMSIHNSLPDNLSPSIEDVIEILDRYETQIAIYLKEAFFEARAIAEKYKNEEEKRKQQFDLEILETTGVDKASRSGK